MKIFKMVLPTALLTTVLFFITNKIHKEKNRQRRIVIR